jgi:hypothetical protein
MKELVMAVNLRSPTEELSGIMNEKKTQVKNVVVTQLQTEVMRDGDDVSVPAMEKLPIGSVSVGAALV